MNNRIEHLLKGQQRSVGRREASSMQEGWPCAGGLHSGVIWGANDPSNIVRDLLQQLSGRADENAGLREEVEELKERLDRVESQKDERLEKCEEMLKQIFDPSDLPSFGEFEKWLMSDEAAKSYQGKHIAFIEGRGIIAASKSARELIQEVERQGNPAGVIFGFVPIPAMLA